MLEASWLQDPQKRILKKVNLAEEVLAQISFDQKML